MINDLIATIQMEGVNAFNHSARLALARPVCLNRQPINVQGMYHQRFALQTRQKPKIEAAQACAVTRHMLSMH